MRRIPTSSGVPTCRIYEISRLLKLWPQLSKSTAAGFPIVDIFVTIVTEMFIKIVATNIKILAASFTIVAVTVTTVAAIITIKI